MDIISQDTIKLGCSGGQGKIQIQTFFERAAQLVLQLSRHGEGRCRSGARILYKSALFMQNKANLLDTQMNVSSVKTKYYENKRLCRRGENKPNSNPIKANLHFTAENAEYAEEKNICVSVCSIEKYALYPISPRSLRTRRLMKNKPKQSQSFDPSTLLRAGLVRLRSPQVAPTFAEASEGRQDRFQNQRLSKLFLFFTFLCLSYNLAMQTWTIQKLLNWVTEYLTNKNIDSPRLSAELLLSHVLKMKRIELYTQFDKPVARQQLDKLHDLVKRAGQHEPIAYLTGKTEFYSLEMNVTPDCMVPRPETELLVERAIEFLRNRPVRNSTMFKTTQKEEISNGASTGTQFVCDLCTGCGCIAVAIAKNFPHARIIATDISDAALNVAAQNVEKYQLNERITLLFGDLFDPIVPKMDFEKLVPDYDQGFDLIVCNPPYVSATEFEKLDKNVKDYEPGPALLAGNDGLDIYRKIFEKVDQFLKPNAALMLEIGFTQGQVIKELLEKAGAFAEIKIEKDLQKNDRIVIAKKMSP